MLPCSSPSFALSISNPFPAGRALKDIMGHTKLETTMRYVHLSQEHRDKAMDMYSQTLERDGKELIQ